MIINLKMRTRCVLNLSVSVPVGADAEGRLFRSCGHNAVPSPGMILDIFRYGDQRIRRVFKAVQRSFKVTQKLFNLFA